MPPIPAGCGLTLAAPRGGRSTKLFGLQLPRYAAYYGIYRTQSTIGGHLPGWANSAMTTVDQGFLNIDDAIDRAKRVPGYDPSEQNRDEVINGSILPLHLRGWHGSVR